MPAWKWSHIRLAELQPRDQRNPDAASSTVELYRGAKSPREGVHALQSRTLSGHH